MAIMKKEVLKLLKTIALSIPLLNTLACGKALIRRYHHRGRRRPERGERRRPGEDPEGGRRKAHHAPGGQSAAAVPACETGP